MIEVHRYAAFLLPAGFVLLSLWVLVSFLRNRAPHDLFWRFLAVLQVVLGVQIVIGAILYLTGSPAPSWRHYAYGGLFPIALLVYAHRAAGSERFRGIPWLPFGIAAFFLFGLTIQALRTGFGS